MYFATGAYAEAAPCYQRALAIWSRALGPEAPETALGMQQFAMLTRAMGQDPQALRLLQRALAVASGAEEPALLKDIQWQLGSCQAKAAPASAIFWCKASINTLQNLRGRMSRMDKSLQKSFLAMNETIYRALADLLLAQGRLAEAHQVLFLLKEREYFELAPKAARTSATPSAVTLTPLEARLQADLDAALGPVATLGEELRALRTRPQLTPGEASRFAALPALYQQALDTFAGAMLDRQGDFERESAGEPARLIPPQARELWTDLGAMAKGTAVVYTLLGEDRAWVLGITSGDLRAWAIPMPRTELASLVEAFRKRLQNPGLDPRPPGGKLYAALVAPLRAWRTERRVSRILWSLDGPLRYIPMGALWNGKAYFIEEGPSTVFTPAARMALAGRHRSLRVLGAGVSRAIGDFPALEAVPRELRGVIREPGRRGGVLPGQVLLDEGFTEAGLRDGLRRGFPVLHLASHFQFSAEAEGQSFLLLGGRQPVDPGSHAHRRTDVQGPGPGGPVGLPDRNGRQGAHGPGDRRLRGHGPAPGRRSGDRHPVARGRRQHRHPHADLLPHLAPAGTPRSEALRQAQLGLLRGAAGPGPALPEPQAASVRFQAPKLAPHAHPFYWAPFILMGNWN